MEQKLYIRVALPVPLRRFYDYALPQSLDITKLVPGVRVQVPFQNRTLIGIVTEVLTAKTVYCGKIKPITAVLDEAPILSPDVTKLCEWAAAYYHYALGEVFMYALPAALRKGQALTEPELNKKKVKVTEAPVLNMEQASAVQAINATTSFAAFLLDGVTGSGKTEVYLQAIAERVQQGNQVLVLVPEISLTPQMLARFESRFDFPIVALHSGLSEKKRFQGWLAARSGLAKVVIGTRSALFTPFKNLGLIIVDEEHDVSFKQQDRFRYHARDAAVMRATLNNIPIVLGSATPSLETLSNVQRKRYQHLILTARAGNAALPSYHVIDVRRLELEDGLSPPLIQAVQKHLDNNQQVMLFLNRRGFAPVLYCTGCGHILECKRCDARMVYHENPKRLQCHHCDAHCKLPENCPQCQTKNLIPLGLGTQRIELVLKKYFPDIPVIRVDRDNTRHKDAMKNLFAQVEQAPKAILLGTQMLAKGHHFPRVTLVGILDADSGFFSANFRGVEHMGQLITQVSGRAGREEKPGTVLVQTRNKDYAYLTTLIQKGYHAFAWDLLTERQKAHMPPFAYFAIFRAEAHKAKLPEAFLTSVKQLWHHDAGIEVLGPIPAPLAKHKGYHCQQLLVKSVNRKHLQTALQAMIPQIEQLKAAKNVKWLLDVDPMEV